MKKVLAASAICFAALTACSKPTEPQAVPSPASETPSTAASGPAVFELRDFAIDREDKSYGGASYNGRGTLVTRDPRLAHGTFLVFLAAKQEHESDAELNTQVLLKDGLGPVRVGTYQTAEEEKTEKVRYYDWNVLGYAELLPGTFQAPAAQPKAATPPNS